MPDDPILPNPDAPASVSDAIAKARAELAAGRSILRPGEPAPAEEPATEPAEAPEQEEAPEEEQAAEGGEQEEPQEEEAEPADEEGTADEEEPEEEVDEEEEPEGAFTVRIPGRRPDDPDIELPLEGLTQEEREGLARLRNGYMRGERVRERDRELGQREAALAEIETGLGVDPVGFIARRVAPEAKRELVRYLLATDARLYEDVVEEVAKWDHDPKEKRAAAAEIERDRDRAAGQAATQAERLKRAHRSLRAIERRLDRLAEGLDEEVRAQFMGYALRDLEDHAKAHRLDALSPDEAVRVLERSGTLRLFRVNPDAPASRTRRVKRREQESAAGSPRLRPARPKGPTEEAIRRRAQETGEEFRARSARRRAAAATAPAGRAATGPVLKKSDRLEDRFALIRKHGLKAFLQRQ